MSGATPTLPNTPSWRGAQLKIYREKQFKFLRLLLVLTSLRTQIKGVNIVLRSIFGRKKEK
jgi:hypothetical protein